MSPTQTFTTLPILPLSSALDPATKPAFLAALRSALLNVGFLYLSETGLPDALVSDVIAECKLFFEALPQEEKERIEMKNERSFLGWSRVSASLFFFNCRFGSVWFGWGRAVVWDSNVLLYWRSTGIGWICYREMTEGYADAMRHENRHATRCKKLGNETQNEIVQIRYTGGRHEVAEKETTA
jgi:uncharacterized membrane protein YidH (DUF202 family)